MNFEKFGTFCNKIYDEELDCYIITYKDYRIDVTFRIDKNTYDSLAKQDKNSSKKLSRLFKLVKGIEQDVTNK